MSNSLIVTFFELYKLSKLKIDYILYDSNNHFNDSCPICLEKFIIFTGDIGNLVFYGSDPVVTRIFGTNIKYAINFIPANTFNGKKSDFVFKLGENGLGYYYDGKNKFMIDDQIINLDIVSNLSCKHAFHQKCFEPWIKKNIKCPLCKKNLPMEKKQDIYLSQEDYQILEEDFLFFQN